MSKKKGIIIFLISIIVIFTSSCKKREINSNIINEQEININKEIEELKNCIDDLEEKNKQLEYDNSILLMNVSRDLVAFQEGSIVTKIDNGNTLEFIKLSDNEIYKDDAKIVVVIKKEEEIEAGLYIFDLNGKLNDFYKLSFIDSIEDIVINSNFLAIENKNGKHYHCLIYNLDTKKITSSFRNYQSFIFFNDSIYYEYYDEEYYNEKYNVFKTGIKSINLLNNVKQIVLQPDEKYSYRINSIKKDTLQFSVNVNYEFIEFINKHKNRDELEYMFEF